MATKNNLKNSPESVNLDAFQWLKESLKRNLIPDPDRDSSVLFESLVSALIKAGRIAPSGKIAGKTNEKAIAYMGKIFPFLTSEVTILQEDSDGFVARFCFAPNKKDVSLASFLQRKSILDENFQLTPSIGWKGTSAEIFEEFRTQREIEGDNLSPFELVADEEILINYWGEEPQDVDLEFLKEEF